MRPGLAAVGSILLLIGILMVVFFWPVLSYETKDTFIPEDASEGKTVRYAGILTNITEVGGIYILELDDGAVEVYGGFGGGGEATLGGGLSYTWNITDFVFKTILGFQ